VMARMIDDALRFRRVGLVAEHHRAEAQRGDAKIGFSEAAVLH